MKTKTILLIFILMSAMATATQTNIGLCYGETAQNPETECFGFLNTSETDDLDKICQHYDFDKATAKYDWDNNLQDYVINGAAQGVTDVIGNNLFADWFSQPSIDGVIVRAGDNYYLQDQSDGYDGGLHYLEYDDTEIDHVIFCRNISEENDIPEFTTIGAGLALLGIGLIVGKKNK